MLEQKVQADVISRISYLVVPRCCALFNYYGHAVLEDGFPERLVWRHVNDAGSD